MKGLKSELIGIVMTKNPKTLDELRQAMVLAEQMNKVTTKTVSVSETLNFQSEMQFLRNQLSEVLAFQDQDTAIHINSGLRNNTSGRHQGTRDQNRSHLNKEQPRHGSVVFVEVSVIMNN